MGGGWPLFTAGPTIPNAPLIAVDTNVLIDLAAKDETVVDCLSTITRKFSKAPIIVPPTVIGELVEISENGENLLEKTLALKALQSIRQPWGFIPINCVPVGHGIVEETARKIRASGLIPDEEVNDSFVIAEAALANATILLSNDGHLKNINQGALKTILEKCDISPLIIFSPWKIVRDFYDSVH